MIDPLPGDGIQQKEHDEQTVTRVVQQTVIPTERATASTD